MTVRLTVLSLLGLILALGTMIAWSTGDWLAVLLGGSGATLLARFVPEVNDLVRRSSESH